MAAEQMKSGGISTMRLQLSLDATDIEHALHILDQACGSIDIVEMGTPLILAEGLKAAENLKACCPNILLLADCKIMDGGYFEAQLAYRMGADIVTVLGAANDATIKMAVKAARQSKKQVMVDLIEIPHIAHRARQVDRLGVDYVCVHTAKDMQNERGLSISDLEIVKAAVQDAEIAVAGGINAENLESILPLFPNIVIIGAGIAQSENIGQTAGKIKRMISYAGK